MNNQNFNGMNMNNMNNYFMFQHFLNSQRNNNMFQQNLNNVNFNQNMFQQYMNQMNMNQNFNQPNFNFNPNMHIGNLNNSFLQNMFQMFNQWLMAQFMNNNVNNFNNNINNNNMNNMNNRINNFNNNINNNINNNNRNNIYRSHNFILNNNNKEPKPILPRSKTFIKVTDFEKGNNDYLLNIVFVAGNGLRVNIPIPYNKTVEYLFQVYARKIGISENVLGSGVIFLYDALYMDVKDKRTLGEVFHGNQYVITVVDAANVLAA